MARAATAALLALAAAGQAVAQPIDYDVPAGPLADVLQRFALQAGVAIAIDANQLRGLRSPGIQGRHGVEEGLDTLLRGSGHVPARTPGGYVLRAAPAIPPAGAPANPAAGTSALPSLPTVTVREDPDAQTATGPVSGYVARRSATGSKTDTLLEETPQSVSVVTSDFIEASGALRLKDALAYTPGINVSPWGADSRFDWTIIRGFDAQTPGYYLDGLPLRNNNGWAIWQTENYGTERIEVLRGPSSVLYGQTGPGGMVNVVSKRPTGEPLRELQMQLGNHGRRQVAGDFSGALDAGGTLQYRLTGMVRDAELQASGLPNDRAYLAPSLTWKPSADTSLTVLAHYLRIRDGSSYGSFPEVGTLLPNPNGRFSPGTYVGEPGFDHFHQDQWMLGYLFEHRLSDTWTLRQNARYGAIRTDYQQVYNQSGFAIVNPDVPGDPANFRQLQRFPFGSRERARLLTLDNQAQARLRLGDWQHTVLVGLDYQGSRNDQRTYNAGTVSNVDGYAPVYTHDVVPGDPWFDARTRLTQTGIYLQDQIRWGDWVATVGGRYDSASTTVDSHTDGSRTRVNDHHFTSRAGLVYLHPSGWAPYVSYSESFSPTATLDPETNAPLKPETGRQYEAGVRFVPPDGKSRYSAAVFDLRRRNYITYTPEFLPRQTGEILVRGLELEAAFQPLRQMNVIAAYTYTPKAVVTASSTASEIGRQMQAVSRNQLSVWADYRFAWGLQLGLGARFMGSNRGYQESAAAVLPSYTVVDALLAYELPHWRLALNLRNLGNKAYLSNCSAGSCRYGDMRQVVATATYRW
jgi:iron complex outermembrane receptor protein